MNKNYPWQQIIPGIIVGLFSVGSFAIAESLDKHFTWGVQTATIRWLTGLLTLVVLGVGIYTGMHSIKKSNAGRLTYRQAFLTGFIITLTAGLITALGSLLYRNVINPGYAADMIAESKKAMAADGKSAADIAAATPMLERQWSASTQVVQALIGLTVCGTAIALIMGIFIKSKKIR
jgi:hypothetical protein